MSVYIRTYFTQLHFLTCIDNFNAFEVFSQGQSTSLLLADKSGLTSGLYFFII